MFNDLPLDLSGTCSTSTLWVSQPMTDQGLQPNFRVHPEAQSKCCGGQLSSASPLLDIVTTAVFEGGS